MKRIIITAAVLANLFCATIVCYGDPLFYAVAGRTSFGTLDPITGTFTLISNLTLNNSENGIIGMGLAADGNLYALGWSGYIYEINPQTGTISYTDPAAAGVPIMDGAGMTGSPSGTLYAYDITSQTSTSLEIIKPLDSFKIRYQPATLVGEMGYGLGGGFAFDASGNLFITKGEGSEQLYGVNPTTGAAKFIGNTGTPDSYDMEFDGDTLYLVDRSGGIWTVDTTTGAATQISNYSNTYGVIDGLAYMTLQSVPEPSSRLLFVCLSGFALFVTYIQNSRKFQKS